MAYNILLVDDSATTRAVIGKTFKVAGIPVSHLYEAANGREALDILKQNWVDLVMTDINMPVMDGMEMIDIMQRDGLLKSIPVILVTIEGNAKRLDHLRSKGVAAVIHKPFKPEQVRGVIEGIINPPAVKDVKALLAESFGKVLEDFAFMCAEPIEGDAMPPARPDNIRASVRFSGPVAGRLTVAVAREASPEIAANVLGLDAGDATAAERAEDALKEIANVTCGDLLTRIAGTEKTFQLSIPEAGALDASGWDRLRDDPGTQPFLVDDCPFLVQLVQDPANA